MADGQLGDLEAPGLLSHRRADHSQRQVGVGGPGAESSERCLHHVVEGETFLHVLLRGEPDFGVDAPSPPDPRPPRVPLARWRLGRLGDADGVGEGFEIQLELVAVGAPADPGGQVVDVGGRSALVNLESVAE